MLKTCHELYWFPIALGIKSNSLLGSIISTTWLWPLSPYLHSGPALLANPPAPFLLLNLAGVYRCCFFCPRRSREPLTEAPHHVTLCSRALEEAFHSDLIKTRPLPPSHWLLHHSFIRTVGIYLIFNLLIYSSFFSPK